MYCLDLVARWEQMHKKHLDLEFVRRGQIEICNLRKSLGRLFMAKNQIDSEVEYSILHGRMFVNNHLKKKSPKRREDLS